MAGVHYHWRPAWGAAALALVLCGCSSMWEEVTSRDFKFKNLWAKPPEPVGVIETSDNGYLRAKALASLADDAKPQGEAPKTDAEGRLKLLTTAAREDKEPLCRLAAIRALGSSKDTRAVRTLEDVYQEAKLPFTQEFNSLIRQQALASLEKNGDDETRHLLIRVARQPGPSNDAGQVDRQQTQDEKLIALRALGRYKQKECIETLAYVLQSEKDVALRDRAHDSLEQITGRKLPYEPEAIQADMLVPGTPPEPTILQRVGGLIKPVSFIP